MLHWFWIVTISAQVRQTKSRHNFSQRTHPIHSIRPKTHILGRLRPFRYCMKVDAKLAKLVPLTHKFAKQSCVTIFHNERSWSTPLDSKLMFWAVSDRFVTAQKSLQNWPNWCYYRTSSLKKIALEFLATNALDPLHWLKTHVLGCSDCFVTARKSMQKWPNWRH
jgi:hypothetical protein